MIKHITYTDILSFLKDKPAIYFVTLPGGMGTPGLIMLVSKNKDIYLASLLRQNEKHYFPLLICLLNAFPELIVLSGINLHSKRKVTPNYSYVYLGCGNSAYIKKDLMNKCEFDKDVSNITVFYNLVTSFTGYTNIDDSSLSINNKEYQQDEYFKYVDYLIDKKYLRPSIFQNHFQLDNKKLNEIINNLIILRIISPSKTNLGYQVIDLREELKNGR